MSIIVSALLAGVVAIGVTVAIERLGGIVGGFLGTLPSTIVPAAAGIWAASSDVASFQLAMAAVPAGMLANAMFLWSWRAVPPSLPALPLPQRLALMGVISMGWWAVWAALLTGAMGQVPQASGLAVGWAVLVVAAVVGVVACLGQPSADGSARRVPPAVLVGRGVLAAAAIAVAVLLAELGSPVLAGMASVFPAIFVTTMVSLWWSQGEAVPAGAVGPMMLGSTAVSAYALVAAWTIPMAGLAAGSGLAWGIAAIGVTLPATTWLRRRQGAPTAPAS